jgi:osmotically-inducible protein OsmY
MSRLLTIALGVAAGAAVARMLDRRKIAARVKHWSRRKVATDDVSIARKVETHIFRPHDAPKGDVSVDVEAGVVYLRGAVNDPWRARLAAEALKVDGVRGVQNLLHLPGTPAPPPPPRGAIMER